MPFKRATRICGQDSFFESNRSHSTGESLKRQDSGVRKEKRTKNIKKQSSVIIEEPLIEDGEQAFKMSERARDDDVLDCDECDASTSKEVGAQKNVINVGSASFFASQYHKVYVHESYQFSDVETQK